MAAEDLLSRFDDYSIGGRGGGGLEGQRRERSLGGPVSPLNPFGSDVVEGGSYQQPLQEVSATPILKAHTFSLETNREESTRVSNSQTTRYYKQSQVPVSYAII